MNRFKEMILLDTFGNGGGTYFLRPGFAATT
jgi:hypothetical protein